MVCQGFDCICRTSMKSREDIYNIMRTRFAANFCSSLYSEFSQAFHFSAAVLGLLDGSARGGMARQRLKKTISCYCWYVKLQQAQQVLMVAMAWVHNKVSCRERKVHMPKICSICAQDNCLEARGW